jgi:hypothetical protein
MAQNRTVSIALVVAILGYGSTATSQVISGQSASAKFRVIATSWEASSDEQKDSLDQLYMPFQSFIPLREHLEARIFLAGVNNDLDRMGASMKLPGLTDTRIQVNQSLSDNRIIASLGFNLPTGKTGLNFEEEWFVTDFLARNFMIYPNRRLGGGFDVNGLLGGVAMAGEFRLGASALYQYTGPYEAYENKGDYDPGNFYSLTAGFKRSFDSFVWIGDFTFTSHTDDVQDGDKIYNRGNQFVLRMGGAWETPKMRGSVDTSYFIRDRNTVYDPKGAIDNQLQIYGNEFSFFGSLSWLSDDKKWDLGPLLHLRTIAANEYELGSALNVGVGAQALCQLTSQYQMGVSFEVFTGDADGGSIDLSGYQVATSISATF